jgi:uncharacterized Zn finger protein (UPF0148 family)
MFGIKRLLKMRCERCGQPLVRYEGDKPVCKDRRSCGTRQGFNVLYHPAVR